MQTEPFSGVTVPLDVEAVAADPIEAGEGSVELFAEIFLEAGAVALNEAVLGAVPLSQDIDGIVELRRSDGGQEAGLQEVVDQVLAGGSHRRFFCRGETDRLASALDRLAESPLFCECDVPRDHHTEDLGFPSSIENVTSAAASTRS